MRAIHILPIVFAFFSATRAVAVEPVKFDKSQLVSRDLPKEHRPDYPVEARRQHRTGSGVFILNINDKTGEVTSITVKKSTGHKILDAACLKAFIKWRFKPHHVTKVLVPITFSMNP